MKLLSILPIALWLSVSMFASPAYGQPDEEAMSAARAAHKRGSALFEKGDFEAASVEFQQAYDKTGAVGVLFNLATALRRADKCQRAADAYERFASESEPSPKQAEAKAFVTKMRACAAEQAKREADEKTTEVAQDLKVVPTPVPLVVSAPPSKKSTSPLPVVGLALGATGVAMIGTGVLFGVWANGDADELNSKYGRGGQWGPEAQALEDSYNTNRIVSYSLFGAGAVFAVAGGALYLLKRDDSQEENLQVQVDVDRSQIVWSLAGSL